MKCSVEGCSRLARYKSTGWCQTHYHRVWRNGSLNVLPFRLRTDLSYSGAHARVKRLFGSATQYTCIRCAAPANEWAYDGMDPTESSELVLSGKYPVTYSMWPEFYMPLCFPCHRGMDKATWVARRTHCRNGHELTDENTYTRPSRPGTRECQACKKKESAARHLRRKNELNGRRDVVSDVNRRDS